MKVRQDQEQTWRKPHISCLGLSAPENPAPWPGDFLGAVFTAQSLETDACTIDFSTEDSSRSAGAVHMQVSCWV